MGFLDFARDVGRQIFDTDAEAADNIKQHLEVKMTGIRNIEVEYDDGVATICGDCDTQKVKEQAILIAGNIQGVSKIVADGLNAPEPPPEVAEVVEAAQVAEVAEVAEVATADEFYEIRSGDTLGKIANQFYGKASQYMRIFEANREIISDPNKIYPGQKIRIPRD